MRPTVLYITGRGHSGSTILDAALGSHPAVESVGELVTLHRSGWTPDPDRRCACGAMVHECGYWTEVRREWERRVDVDRPLARYMALQERFQRHRYAWDLVPGLRRTRTARFRLYADMTAALYASIAAVSGRPVLVDSSKNPLLARDLLHMPGLDVGIVHLVRDGRNVVRSYKKHRERSVPDGRPRTVPPRPALSSATAWTLVNLETELLLRSGRPDRVVRVRYEDLLADPERTLGSVGDLVGLDYGPTAREVAGGGWIEFGHMVAGNSIRLRKRVRLERDPPRPTPLAMHERVTFAALGGLLNRRYGYGRE